MARSRRCARVATRSRGLKPHETSFTTLSKRASAGKDAEFRGDPASRERGSARECPTPGDGERGERGGAGQPLRQALQYPPAVRQGGGGAEQRADGEAGQVRDHVHIGALAARTGPTEQDHAGNEWTPAARPTLRQREM